MADNSNGSWPKWLATAAGTGILAAMAWMLHEVSTFDARIAEETTALHDLQTRVASDEENFRAAQAQTNTRLSEQFTWLRTLGDRINDIALHTPIPYSQQPLPPAPSLPPQKNP
jgi:hypothetical protein